MLRIKKAEDIDLDDLPKIELPFFAKSSVERAFSGVQGFDSIWGLDEVLRDISPGIYPTGRNKYQLAQLLDMIEKGRIFLLKDNYSSFNKIMWYILVKSGESKCYVYSTKKPDLLVENLDSYYIQKRKTNKFFHILHIDILQTIGIYVILLMINFDKLDLNLALYP